MKTVRLFAAMTVAVSLIAPLAVVSPATAAAPSKSGVKADPVLNNMALLVHHQGVGNQCSGGVMKGGYILTARHCLFDKYGEPAAVMDIWFGRSLIKNYKHSDKGRPDCRVFPNSWVHGDQTDEGDWAVIRINGKSDCRSGVKVPVGIPLSGNEAWATDDRFEIRGYPGRLAENGNIPIWVDDNVRPTDKRERGPLRRTFSDATGGVSGAPLIQWSNGKPYITGILTQHFDYPLQDENVVRFMGPSLVAYIKIAKAKLAQQQYGEAPSFTVDLSTATPWTENPAFKNYYFLPLPEGSVASYLRERRNGSLADSYVQLPGRSMLNAGTPTLPLFKLEGTAAAPRTYQMISVFADGSRATSQPFVWPRPSKQPSEADLLTFDETSAASLSGLYPVGAVGTDIYYGGLSRMVQYFTDIPNNGLAHARINIVYGPTGTGPLACDANSLTMKIGQGTVENLPIDANTCATIMTLSSAGQPADWHRDLIVRYRASSNIIIEAEIDIYHNQNSTWVNPSNADLLQRAIALAGAQKAKLQSAGVL